jgi:hypothetical protein
MLLNVSPDCAFDIVHHSANPFSPRYLVIFCDVHGVLHGRFHLVGSENGAQEHAKLHWPLMDEFHDRIEILRIQGFKVCPHTRPVKIAEGLPQRGDDTPNISAFQR